VNFKYQGVDNTVQPEQLLRTGDANKSKEAAIPVGKPLKVKKEVIEVIQML